MYLHSLHKSRAQFNYRKKEVNSFEFDIEVKHISQRQIRHLNCFRSNDVHRMGMHRLRFTPNINQYSNVNYLYLRQFYHAIASGKCNNFQNFENV